MDRTTPTDHFTMLFETDKSPMNIGGLLLFDVPPERKADFVDRLRAHLEARVPRTVLARRLLASPDHYDADAWFRIRGSEAAKQIRAPQMPDLSEDEARIYVTRRGMQPLDLTKAPFEIDILPMQGSRGALYVKQHHGVADGVGFQAMIQLLSDTGGGGLGEPADADEEVPAPERWTEMARAKFEREAPDRAAAEKTKAEAKAALEAFLADPAHARLAGPPMWQGQFSDQRTYRTLSLGLDPVRAAAKALEASVNDIFLAVAAGALRRYLTRTGQLPADPLVSHSVRSTRRPEHGDWGNQVLSIYPELATDEPDPLARLRRIRASMNVEKQRSQIEERLNDVLDWPFGARDRRAACANPALIESVLGPANVVLSNVPGPAERLSFAGFPLLANYPVPIVGPGRFLNITSRRNADALDMGVMVDAAKILDADTLIADLRASYDELVAAAQGR